MPTSSLDVLIESSGFFSGMSAEHRHKLAEISQVIDFPAGAEIFAEGSVCVQLFVVVEGRVELCMTIASRGCLPILTLETGDLLGWSAALGHHEMSAKAVAIQRTQVIAISADKLRQLCQDDHEIGYEIMHRVAHSLSRRLIATRLQLLDLFSASPVEIPVRDVRGH